MHRHTLTLHLFTTQLLLSLIGCGISWRWLPGKTVSAHTSWDIWGPDRPQGFKGGWTRDNTGRYITHFWLNLISHHHLGVQWYSHEDKVEICQSSLFLLSQLSQDGLVNQSEARLLHELGERVRVLLHSYFRSPSGLYVSFTHLVCRSAIAGNTNSLL